jgi:hypothetical protein
MMSQIAGVRDLRIDGDIQRRSQGLLRLSTRCPLSAHKAENYRGLCSSGAFSLYPCRSSTDKRAEAQPGATSIFQIRASGDFPSAYLSRDKHLHIASRRSQGLLRLLIGRLEVADACIRRVLPLSIRGECSSIGRAAMFFWRFSLDVPDWLCMYRGAVGSYFAPDSWDAASAAAGSIPAGYYFWRPFPSIHCWHDANTTI